MDVENRVHARAYSRIEDIHNLESIILNPNSFTKSFPFQLHILNF